MLTRTPLRLSLCAALLLVAAGCAAPASEANPPPGWTTVALDDLGTFRPVAANWRIAGGAESDPSVREHLSATPGTGVLVNQPGPALGDNLFTVMEHGDLELELEFLMPAASNSGVYLQGRYEIQLRDSWGVENPGFGYTGGIYERFDENRPQGQQGFEGVAPLVNASRPPGEWQSLRIVFEAPRFDGSGRKTENARFLRVEHNGVLVQENVQVTGPTRAAAWEDEQPLGPLMLQGDHGPIAFRNIRYRSR
jgi:hypothetical protein